MRMKNVKTMLASLALLCLVSCTDKSAKAVIEEQGKAESVQQAETLDAFYRRYIAAANARDLDAIAGMVSDDVIINGVKKKKEDSVGGFQYILDAVPDYEWKIEDLFTDGERIACRLTDTGTPTKTFLGNEPTGASISITEFASYRVRNGKFIEMWYLIDAAQVKEQLKK
ncbi:ester cyclase [Flavobacterium zepuense]|uniref:Ester cyclase n=2 Tax=Flavobacterium zepuense TaxID=2593302 RepID=A0A552V9Q2_9FLAO|nr:ester cyclase [Flavobacterium zepuense]